MTTAAPTTTPAIEREIQLLIKTLDAARQKEDAAALNSALIQLGQAYLDAGDVPKALTQFEEGLALAQSRQDEEFEARFWGYKGICLVRLGNTHFAQIALFKSHNMAKALGHKCSWPMP
jgi:tetratricopeptide (TPR) repeat protein